MTKRFLTFLALTLLSTQLVWAQSEGGMTINLTGDSGTEQAAKLELIRILQERMNKLTVAQLNSRIIVSRGVTEYYKVDEILKMQQEMWNHRTKYVTLAGHLEKANPGFSASQGNGFAYKYIGQYNAAMKTADMVRKQLELVTKSGQPIKLPAMPTFTISAATPGTSASELENSIQTILAAAGVHSEEDWNNLPQDKKDAINQQIKDANKAFFDALQKQAAEGNKKVIQIVGNVVGSMIGVPNAGTMLVNIGSGGLSKVISGLVGSIVDNFQVPVDYYDSSTLKLTDAERIRIIDELHVRISEAYQQVTALGASMSTETKKRYNELSQPRNEVILYGPKK